MTWIVMDPWPFLLVALAAFRFTRFFVYDKMLGASPQSGSNFSVWLDVFAYTTEGANRSWLRGKLGDLLTCPWCLGFWITGLTMLAWLSGVLAAQMVIQVFALAGAAALLQTFDR